MNVYKFGNFEAEFDPTDVAFVEKYEIAAENYQKKIKGLAAEGKASETMKAVCDIFFATFDGIFGEGTSEKMFGKTQSLDMCVKAFKQLVNSMNDYSKMLKMLPNVTKDSAENA